MRTAEVLEHPGRIAMPTCSTTQETPLTVEHPPPLAEGIPEDPGRPDVAKALRTLTSFTPEQVAWLMATAMRWGYELRVDEENAAYPPQPVLQFGRWFDQDVQRREADAEARLPRVSDYHGGPAPVWGENDLEVAA